MAGARCRGVVVGVGTTCRRSDWHAWQGHDPDVRLLHVPGHELAGTSRPSVRTYGAGASATG